MTIKKFLKIKKLETQFFQIRKEILDVGPFRKGSILERRQICGNPNCRCRKNMKYRHGPYYSWTLKNEGKTKTIIVPPELLSEAKEFLKNAEIFKKKTESLIQVSDKIFRIKVELARDKKVTKN